MIVTILTYAVGMEPTQATIVTDLASWAALAIVAFIPKASPFAGMEFADYFRLGFVGLLALGAAVIIALSLLTNL